MAPRKTKTKAKPIDDGVNRSDSLQAPPVNKFLLYYRFVSFIVY